MQLEEEEEERIELEIMKCPQHLVNTSPLSLVIHNCLSLSLVIHNCLTNDCDSPLICAATSSV